MEPAKAWRHVGQRGRRAAATVTALALLLLALLPDLPHWPAHSSASPAFVALRNERPGGFGPRRSLRSVERPLPRAAEPGSGDYGDAVFEDLFDDEEEEGNEAVESRKRVRGFRESSAPRRIPRAQQETALSEAEEWGAMMEAEGYEEEDEEDGDGYDQEEQEEEEEPEPEEPEISDAEVEEFLAELQGRPTVVKEEGTVPLDPFGKDASKELDTFRELRTSESRGLLYQRGLPDQQQLVTLKDRLMMLADYAEAGDWQQARYVMKGVWKKRRLRLPFGRFLWNLMIKAHANANRPQAAESWVNDMLKRVYQPDIVSYNTLLNLYGKRGDFLKAEKWLRHMRARGVDPDMYSYGAVASAYAKAGDLQGTERTVRALVDSGCKIDASNTLPHNSVLKLCAQRGRNGLARLWFENMEADGVTPDSVSYLQMIRASAQADDLEGAAAWLKRMAEAGLEPRRQHFHAVMTAHARRSDLEGAEVWFRVMQDEGNIPDTCSYNILMSAVSQIGSTQEAEGIMARMQEVKILPDVITYNTLIGAFAEAGNATGAKYWLLQAETDGVEPDLKCYNQAIKACARAGNSTMGEQLARRLLRHSLTPDAYTYNTLLTSLAKDGSWAPAEFWADHLQRSARWRHNEFPLKQIAMAYSEVLLAHVVAGNMQAAESWHAQMLGEGVEPDARSYSALIRKYLELGQLDEARKWCDRMVSWSNYRVPDDLEEAVYGDERSVRMVDGAAQEVPEPAVTS